MDIDKFGNSPVGHLVPITGTDGRDGSNYEHSAFAPQPLSGPPDLTTETWVAVASASRAIGRLLQGAQLVPNPGLLRRPTLRREAQSTSALEGTYAPLEEVLAADLIQDADRSSALSEVLNYVDAAELAFAWVGEGRPITTTTLAELHRVLVRGTAADNVEAGRVRRIQVVIGSRGGSIYDARFIPLPPGPVLESGFTDLLDWMKPSNHPGTDPIVAAAMAHYQFETLHPFNDGNGRIGRLLIVVQLVVEQVLTEGLLSVSPWFEARREQYQDLLAGVSANGDWDSWIRFFAEGLEASAMDTARRIEDLLAIRAEFEEVIREAGAKGLIRDIADLLVGNPYVTVPAMVAATGKTYQAVNVAIGRLVDLGILEEMPNRSPRAFRAPDVVATITRRTSGR